MSRLFRNQLTTYRPARITKIKEELGLDAASNTQTKEERFAGLRQLIAARGGLRSKDTSDINFQVPEKKKSREFSDDELGKMRDSIKQKAGIASN